MGRIPPDQATKGGKLAKHLVGHRREIVGRSHLVHRYPGLVTANPFAKIQMKPETEARICSAVLGRLGGGRPPYHQAGTGYDARFVGLDDAAVDAQALTKVVRIDNQEFASGHRSNPQVVEELRQHGLRFEKLLCNVPCSTAMPRVIRVNPIEGSNDFVEGVESKKPLAGRE